MNNDKLVTVCMCTRNRAKLMLKSIKTILTQTYKNFELLIINDASTDDTENVLLELEQLDNRIRHITLEQHDFILARNIAIREAKGEYICIMDSDDSCAPNRLEEQVKYLNDNLDVDVVSCKMLFWGKTKNIYKIPKQLKDWNNDYFVSELQNGENISMLLQFATIMFRKEIVNKIFKNKMYFYPEFNHGGEDTMFLYSLHLNGAKFANITSTVYLYNYLEYDDSISSSIGKHFDNNNFIFKYIHDKPYNDRINITKELYVKYNGEV